MLEECYFTHTVTVDGSDMLLYFGDFMDAVDYADVASTAKNVSRVYLMTDKKRIMREFRNKNLQQSTKSFRLFWPNNSFTNAVGIDWIDACYRMKFDLGAVVRWEENRPK